MVFSSVAGVMGGGGQGTYAAANAYLDAAMAHRRAAGLPGLSLAWGLWERGTGMATHLSTVDHARASRSGVLEMSQAEGLALFDTALRSDASVLVPIKLDLAAIRAAGRTVPHLLRGLVRPGRQQARVAAVDDGGLLRTLRGLAPMQRQAHLIELVRGQVAVVLGHEGTDAVRADTAFREAGFDSLTSVELRNRLSAATGLKLPATLVFDYPTPLELARHLLAELAPKTGDANGIPAGSPAGTGEVDEVRLRHALASVPLTRLREAGLIDALVRLAGVDEPAADAVSEADEQAIAELDVDDLVQLALGDE